MVEIWVEVQAQLRLRAQGTNILWNGETSSWESTDLHWWLRDKFLHIPAQVTDFVFVCPLSRKSSWQRQLKRTSLPIWVSSTSSLGREMRRPPLLLGWMIPCAYISVYPICLPLCGSPVIHFQTAFDFHTLLCCCCCQYCCCLDYMTTCDS